MSDNTAFPPNYGQQYPPVVSPKSSGNRACVIAAVIFVFIAVIAVAVTFYAGSLLGRGVGKIFSAAEAGLKLYEAEAVAMEYYEDHRKFTDNTEELAAVAIRPRRIPRINVGNSSESVKFVKGVPAEVGEVGVTLCQMLIPPDFKAPGKDLTPTPLATSDETTAQTGPNLDATATPLAPQSRETFDQVMVLQVKFGDGKAISSLMIEGEVMYRAFDLATCPTSLPPEGAWIRSGHRSEFGENSSND